MAEADAKLLFGVAMAGDEEGDSEKQIQEDLKNIIDRINKKGLKVQIGLEAVGDGKGGRQSWNTIVRKKLEELSKNDKFSVKISKIDITGSAIKDFKDQLSRVISTMTLDKTVSVTLGTPTGDVAGETKKVSQNTKETGQDAIDAAKKMAVFNAEMKTLLTLRNQIANGRTKIELADGLDGQAEQIQKIVERYNEWIQKVAEVQKTKAFGVEGSSGLIAEGKAIAAEISALQGHAQAAELDAKAIKKADDALREANKNREKWTSARTGKSSAAYEEYIKAADGLRNLTEQYRAHQITKSEFEAGYTKFTQSMADSKRIIEANGEATRSLSDRLGGLAKKFASWFTVSQLIMTAYRTIKKMVAAVEEIDVAMTELKKVTDETATTYDRFLTNAASRAKELGTTISDIVTATADFARLGYNITDASTLADVAVVYKNVGDGIANISDASESIISTMKAFGISANDAMSIVDKFNEVGNNFAISSKGVGDALLRSASAMHAAGNDIDETIALATAANTIIQSPEKVGTTLKTISMFLRSAKTELEDAGESTEGMVESVSKLRGDLLALTGGRVDIQIDEDTYKSTIQILRELSEVWGDLTDLTHANILEMIGGKRNANVTAALIENFSLVEDVLETSRNAAGSALKENEKYMESIAGHIAQFKAAFQELSATVVDSSSIKFFVDIGKWLLNALNTLTKILSVFGGIKGVLIIMAGVVATIKSQNIVNFVNGIGNIPSAASKAITSLKTLVAAATAADWAFAAVTLAITGFIVISNAVQAANQRRVDAMNDAANAANEERETIAKLTDEYKRLAEAGIDTDDKREQARNIQEQITDLVGAQADNLDLVNGKLDEQLGKLREIAGIEAGDNAQAVNAKYNDAIGQFNAGIDARAAKEAAGLFGISREQGRGYVGNTVRRMGGNFGARVAGLAGAEQGKNAQELLDLYTDLLDRIQNFEGFQDELTDGSNNEVKRAADYLVQQIEIYQGIVDEFNSAKSAKFQNDALAETYQYLEQHNVKTQEQFDEWIETINSTERASDEYRQILIDTANNAFPQFAGAAEEAKDALSSVFEISAYDGVKDGFEGVAAKIEEIRDAMEPLTKLQDAIAEGFTMSIDKALEFAKVYPEILNKAELSADGQITLNEDVVKSFIDGKQQEIDANIEKEVAILEAEQKTYQGKMELAKAELEYLTQIQNGKIEVTRGEAEYRIKAAKAIAQALIDGGAQESEAYALAAAAMSGDMKTFAKISMEVGKNVDHNLLEAAKSVANGMATNMGSSMDAVAALGSQAYETSKVIDGMKTGSAKPVARVQKPGGAKNSKGGNYITQYTDTGTGNPHGNKSSYGNFALTWSDVGGFNGSEYTFTDKGTYGLDDYIIKLDAEIGDYQKAINNLEGQIAALRAGKKIPTSDSSKSSKDKSSGKSSGSKSDSSKDEELERLKSIVALLESELKIMEAQNAPASERIEKIREIQDALKDEIAYLKSIGGDQETINNLSLQWINYQKEIDDIYSQTAENAKKAVDDLAQYRVKMLKDELKKRKENLDKQLDALKEFYDRQKKLLDDQRSEEKYRDEQAQKRKVVSDIEAQIEQLRYDDSAWAQKRRIELEEELVNAKKDLDDFEKDHALDVTKDQLDKEYELQAKALEKEREAIDQELEDENGLYQKAFNDIKNGSIDIYKELAKWVKENGDPVADSIKEAWDAAYNALKDYRDLYGKDYEGVKLEKTTGGKTGGGKSGGGNSSGGKPSSGSKSGGSSGGSGSKSGGSSGNSGGKSGGSVSATLTDGVKRKVAAAIWNGGYGWGTGQDRARKLREVFGDNNGIQELVNKGVGRNDKAPSKDYTYLKMRKKFRGYYTGTRSATPGWHAIDERGNETTFVTADGTRYKLFTGGEKVLNAKASNFLYDFAVGGRKMFDDMFRAVTDPRRSEITPPVRQYEINAGDIIVQGNADRATVSEIRRARKESVELLLKEFSRLNR